jgi:hypothetical protein
MTTKISLVHYLDQMYFKSEVITNEMVDYVINQIIHNYNAVKFLQKETYDHCLLLADSYDEDSIKYICNQIEEKLNANFLPPIKVTLIYSFQ